MTAIRMAVIGVGALGRHHARILAGLDGVELIGVVDADPQQGQQVAESAGTQWYPDHRGLLTEVDAVTIAVPTFAHARIATDFLDNGIHTLVEKPLTADLSEAIPLVRAAERTGALLQVGHVERFNPAFQTAAPLCDNPRYIRAERLSPFSFRSTDIGVVHDLLIHDLDLVLALTGSTVRQVDAVGMTLMGEHEDAVQVRLTFENGCIADLSASRIHPQARRATTIWTATRCIQVDFAAGEVTSYQPSNRLQLGPSPVELASQPGADLEQLKKDVFGSFIEVTQVPVPARDALTAELTEFVNCIQNDTNPTVTGQVALQSLEVAERILGILQARQSESATASPLVKAA